MKLRSGVMVRVRTSWSGGASGPSKGFYQSQWLFIVITLLYNDEGFYRHNEVIRKWICSCRTSLKGKSEKYTTHHFNTINAVSCSNFKPKSSSQSELRTLYEQESIDQKNDFLPPEKNTGVVGCQSIAAAITKFNCAIMWLQINLNHTSSVCVCGSSGPKTLVWAEIAPFLFVSLGVFWRKKTQSVSPHHSWSFYVSHESLARGRPDVAKTANRF